MCASSALRWVWGERMNIWDILILLAVAAMLLLAVRAVRGGEAGSCHKGGGCSCGCENCPACEKKKNEK